MDLNSGSTGKWYANLHDWSLRASFPTCKPETIIDGTCCTGSDPEINTVITSCISRSDQANALHSSSVRSKILSKPAWWGRGRANKYMPCRNVTQSSLSLIASELHFLAVTWRNLKMLCIAVYGHGTRIFAKRKLGEFTDRVNNCSEKQPANHIFKVFYFWNHFHHLATSLEDIWKFGSF